MKTLKEISTHIAILENGVINIYSKGLTPEDLDEWFVKKYPDVFKDELLWTIPIGNEDDLFAIFDNLEENNRCNVDEFENEMQS